MRKRNAGRVRVRDGRVAREEGREKEARRGGAWRAVYVSETARVRKESEEDCDKDRDPGWVVAMVVNWPQAMSRCVGMPRGKLKVPFRVRNKILSRSEALDVHSLTFQKGTLNSVHLYSVCV